MDALYHHRLVLFMQITFFLREKGDCFDEHFSI